MRRFQFAWLMLASLCIASAAHAGPNDIAIIIGNRDYQGSVPKVEFAERDAEAFAKAARDVLGVPDANIIRLPNATGTVFRRWFGADGAGSAQLTALVKGKDAKIYIFYSGHGMPSEASGPVLLPVDAVPDPAANEGYPIERIREAVSRAQREKAPDGRVILLFDACFSGNSNAGTLLPKTSAVSLSASKLRENSTGREVMISASAANEVAYWDTERKHGAFTDALLDGIYGGAADASGTVTAEGLAGFIKARVEDRLARLYPSERKIQTPMLASGDGKLLLASLAKDMSERPVRDEEAVARERTLCRTLPSSTDMSRIQDYVSSCRLCTCRDQLATRLRELGRAKSTCDAEARELDRLLALGDAGRAEIETLARTADCPQVRASAQARHPAVQACAAAADLDTVDWEVLVPSRAIALCREALSAAPEHAPSLSNLGRALNKGKQYEEAKSVLRRAVEKDDASAMTNLGDLYDEGRGYVQDYAEAHRWFEKAAARGNAKAMNDIGIHYLFGWGVAQDFAQAHHWFEKAVGKGHVPSIRNIGELYRAGNGVPKDIDIARQYFEQAAAKGDAIAMATIGYLYANGDGVPENVDLARKWWEKAAARGQDSAMASLGTLYEHGLGVKKDFGVARQWYEKSAEKGNSSAYVSLSEFYAFGRGVKQDCARAREYFAKAREIEAGVKLPDAKHCGRF